MCGMARKDHGRRSRFGEDKPRVQRNLHGQDHCSLGRCFMPVGSSVKIKDSNLWYVQVLVARLEECYRAPQEC